MSDLRTLHAKRLREAYEAAKRFRAEGVSSWTPDFTDWRETTIQSIGVVFGPSHPYTERFQGLRFDEKRADLDDRLWANENRNTFNDDFQRAEKLLQAALEELSIPAAQSQKEADVFVIGQPPGRDAAWYDVAQVCLNGHLVNDRTKSSPDHNQAFCGKCGKPTIIACPKCNSPIRGYYHVPRVVALGSDAVDNFCLACGAPYPWTSEKLEAARAYADEAEGLSPEEKEIFKKSFDDLIVESPRTQLAVIRFKKLLPKVGQQIGGALRDLLVDIASETAKKALWPSP